MSASNFGRFSEVFTLVLSLEFVRLFCMVLLSPVRIGVFDFCSCLVSSIASSRQSFWLVTSSWASFVTTVSGSLNWECSGYFQLWPAI